MKHFLTLLIACGFTITIFAAENVSLLKAKNKGTRLCCWPSRDPREKSSAINPNISTDKDSNKNIEGIPDADTTTSQVIFVNEDEAVENIKKLKEMGFLPICFFTKIVSASTINRQARKLKDRGIVPAICIDPLQDQLQECVDWLHEEGIVPVYFFPKDILNYLLKHSLTTRSEEIFKKFSADISKERMIILSKAQAIPLERRLQIRLLTSMIRFDLSCEKGITLVAIPTPPISTHAALSDSTFP